MIAFPAFLSRNGVIFAAGALLGALAAWGPASCAGKHQANAANAQKVITAAAKVEASAERAAKAAALTDMALSTKTRGDAEKLREIVREQATDDAVGAGMQSVLERVRGRAGAR